MESMNLVFAIATIMDYEIHQIDFKTAYLNSYLDPGTDIYMEQPSYFTEKDRLGYVWKLLKSLYGLGCSGRNWYSAVW